MFRQCGRKQVGSETTGEKGELVSVVYTTETSGNAVPPMFIFPRVNYRNHFIKGALPGSIGCAVKSGSINEELIIQYMHHIIQQTRCSKEHKIILILDNHESYITLKVVDLGRDKGSMMLILSLHHTYHRLQPLERAFYDHFSMLII